MLTSFRQKTDVVFLNKVTNCKSLSSRARAQSLANPPSQTPHTLRPSSRHCRDPLLWVSQSHCEAMVALWSCLLGRSPPSTLVSFVVFLEWPSLLSLWLSLSLNELRCIPCHCHCLWTTFVAFLADIPLARKHSFGTTFVSSFGYPETRVRPFDLHYIRGEWAYWQLPLCS